ncbi:FGGY-family carbohydrate kinase [Burkholderia pseudomallei]|uniref:xylulokinase n=1 Tax=Burkholderia pseudomallei TaxID=28450 RepID=UPI002932F8B1|nr:FGGY-family carbohydrate kinase [Burkholderia pseudomallei]MDV2185776.1 FGGY-family carbohydrate kinase [Burkholderia pseudomallei]
MTEPCVLAIDLGTSGSKAAIISLDGRVVAAARDAVATLRMPNGGVEQDPLAVWRAVKRACGGALRAAGIASRDVLAVACASQYSSIVPVGADGAPVANMMLWLDRRGAPRARRGAADGPLRADSPLRQWRWLRVHGLPPVEGGISLTHMRYLKHAKPDVYARTATFLEPMDYLNLCFTGRACANQCTAFMSLVVDNRRLNVACYDPRLVRYSRIDASKLPELLPVDAIVGRVLPDVADELGLPRGTPVVAGLNDTQAGGIGAHAFAGEHAALSIGSSSVMIAHVRFKRTDIRHAILSMPSPIPDTYFVMAENGIGGAALKHFIEQQVYADDPFGALPRDDCFARLQKAIDATPPGSGGVMFMPWLAGSLAPHADASMRGGFVNLGLDATRSHLARAVLEGVAMNLRWLRGPVEAFAKRRFSHFVFYGGGAESDAWSQIVADVLDAPVHRIEQPQYTTCVGVALLAFQRLGLLGFDDFASRVRIRGVCEPNRANARVYAEMSAQFVEAFRRNRPIFRALQRNLRRPASAAANGLRPSG